MVGLGVCKDYCAPVEDTKLYRLYVQDMEANLPQQGRLRRSCIKHDEKQTDILEMTQRHKLLMLSSYRYRLSFDRFLNLSVAKSSLLNSNISSNCITPGVTCCRFYSMNI